MHSHMCLYNTDTSTKVIAHALPLSYMYMCLGVFCRVRAGKVIVFVVSKLDIFGSPRYRHYIIIRQDKRNCFFKCFFIKLTS